MVKTINWQNLRGCRTYHDIDVRMLEGKVTKTIETRPVPYRDYGSGTYRVEFDRSYVLAKIHRDLIRPLGILGLDAVLAIVTEAYQSSYPAPATVELDEVIDES